MLAQLANANRILREELHAAWQRNVALREKVGEQQKAPEAMQGPDGQRTCTEQLGRQLKVCAPDAGAPYHSTPTRLHVVCADDQGRFEQRDGGCDFRMELPAVCMNLSWVLEGQKKLLLGHVVC